MDQAIPAHQAQLPVNFPTVQHELNEEHRHEHLYRTQHRIEPSRSSIAQTHNRTERDYVSLTTTQRQLPPWELSLLSRKVLKQILGLNPFKTSYSALFRPLESFSSRCLLLAAVLLAVAAGAPLPIIGLLFGKIIDQFPPSEEELRIRLGQLMATACAYFGLTWGWSVCWGTIGETVSRKLREQTFFRLLGMDQAFFELQEPDVAGMLTEKIQTIQLGTSEKVGLFIQSISYFVAAFVVGFTLDAKLAGILLATVIPAMVVIVVSGATLTSRFSKRATEYSEEAANFAESIISGVKTVQAVGAHQVLCQRYQDTLTTRTKWGFRKGISAAMMLGLVYFVAYAANALAFFIGSREIERQSGSGAGTVYAVVFLILDASFVVGQFGPFIQTFAVAAAAGEGLFELLDRPTPQIDVYSSQGTTIQSKSFQSPIQFNDVNFVYPSRPTVRALDGLCLTIKPGVMNGIVGSSGSGKSTLINLLLRLYDPSSGMVVLDGKDIREYNLASLRSRISLVGQDPVLFSGTILDNVRHGLDLRSFSADDDILSLCLRALHEAGCDEFISTLPDGVHTRLGSSGFSSLSGGQKQRIALARALVSSPSLLILDEYTSAMDAKSEAFVLDTLRMTSQNRTIVIIAHRLATVRDCNVITVMGEGRVIEQGSHESLLNSNGAYRALVDAQTVNSSTPALSEKSSSITCEPPLETKPSEGSEMPVETPEADVNLSKVTLLQIFRRVLLLSKAHIVWIVIGLFAAAISGATLIGEAVVFGNLISLLNSDHQSMHEASFFCLMFFVIALIALFSYCTSGVAFGYVSEKLVLTLQNRSLRTILRQDVAWFGESHHSPYHLVSSMDADAGRVSGLSGVILGTIVSALTSVLGGIVLAHVVAWKIAIVLLACVPIMLLSGFFRLKILAKSEERRQTSYNDAAALASESCSAIRTVASLSLEHELLRSYKELLEQPYRDGIRFALWGNILLAFSLSITYFIYALAYWW